MPAVQADFFRKKSGNAAVQAISPATCRWRKGRNVAGESIECCSGLTFIWEVEELGSKKVVELLPRANRKKYIDLLIRHQFVTSIAQQLEDLDGMLHGNESAISVDDWKAHTEYDGYKETDPQICWFWELLSVYGLGLKLIVLSAYLPSTYWRDLVTDLATCPPFLNYSSIAVDRHLQSNEAYDKTVTWGRPCNIVRI
ncbi:E3 ubiquitin protein ligase UPL5 isoform X1 [Tanacetum coccineum]